MSYTTAEIARALRVNPRRLTSAIERGLIPADRGNGTGNHRTFSRDDVFRFALMTRLAELGISRARASVIAGRHSHADGVLVVTPDDARVQPRERFEVPAASTIVDLDLLRNEVGSRLAAVA